ncbi:MAG: response regulator [Longimicrobiales bacterium]|nr:response regulator [Longimicrobiales bacterium]
MARILIVDEDATARRVIRALLEDAGHEVVEAENGHAGLSSMGQEVPDLVITELYMREMDGIEFLRAIRDAWPDEPVLVMSARKGPGVEGILKIAEVLGASGLLDKPIVQKTLLEKVGAILAA